MRQRPCSNEGRERDDAATEIAASFRDAADLAWQPVDGMLASRKLSNLLVLIVTLATAMIFIRQGRVYALADNLGSVAVVWGAAFGLIHYGRKWRDVKPPERKPNADALKLGADLRKM